MEKVRVFFINNGKKYGIGVALVLMILFFQMITQGIFMNPQNINNFIFQEGYSIILSLGMLLCILTGNIDLSVGSVAGFVGAISAILSIQLKLPVVLTILLSLMVGALIGAWQGYWIAYVRIPALIVTLVGMVVFRVLTVVILKGEMMHPFPESFCVIGTGYIPDLIGIGKIHVTTLIIGVILSIIYVLIELRKRKNILEVKFKGVSLWCFSIKLIVVVVIINCLSYWLACYNGMPIVLILLIVLTLIYSFITNKIVTGTPSYALVRDEKTTKFVGVKANRVLFWIYVNIGILSALAGVIFTGRFNSASPIGGTNLAFNVIAACYIGGASVLRGRGTICGCIIGALIIGVVDNGMILLGVGSSLPRAIKWLIFLIALAFDIYNKKKVKNDGKSSISWQG